jgi:redox-sensitive bicupin YhaK (pirin superfamily)
MIRIRRSDERGRADLGWLDSRHTFSFADYYDPAQMGFRSLRVINEDRVAAGGGFPSHPHRDMEIFSYVLSGSLQHKDSMGNGRTLGPGQVQLMGAGTGVLHSEFNPSPSEPAHFLQIWIQPREKGLPPRYTEWMPASSDERAAKVLLISPDGRANSATIAQDAEVYRLRLTAGEGAEHELRAGRGAWLQVMRGDLRVGDKIVGAGDGVAIEEEARFHIAADTDAEALLFDLA